MTGAGRAAAGGRSVAFFAMPQDGHFNRLLPLVSGIADRGITAHVLTHSRFEEAVERARSLAPLLRAEPESALAELDLTEQEREASERIRAARPRRR